MKKLGALLIVGTLFLTGCGNKVVCSSTVKDGEESYKVKITANMKSNKVSSVDGEMTFESEASAEKMCSMLNLVNSFSSDEEKKLDFKCKGKKITIKNYDKLESDDAEDKLVGLTKDEFIKKMTEGSDEESKVTCK